jgi:hypothetical protein
MNLPNDVLVRVVQCLDFVSIIRLQATCKELHSLTTEPLKKRKINQPIHYYVKDENKSYYYDNALSIIDDIYAGFVTDELDVIKQYTSCSNYVYYILQLCRFSETFIFRMRCRGKSFVLQYHRDVDQFRLLKIDKDIKLPLLFLYIGLRVLYRVAQRTPRIDLGGNCPAWFQSLMINDAFSGHLYVDLVNGFFTV